MKPLNIKINKDFVDRELEIEKLKKVGFADEASIIVMYGRRRIGKTEILEQTFRKRNILKFEGIEGKGEKDQLANVISQLAKYTEDSMLSKMALDSWSDFFQLLARYTKKGEWTIYLEEVQWLANYESTLISELKYVWDNYFRHNPQLIVILCGSSPSFMIDNVVHSKALYNRSQYEFNLREFNLLETKEFLKRRSNREILDAYLTIGGVPEYLKWVNKESSVFLSICNNAFMSDSFFSREYERIFTSSLSKNIHYKQIIELLSKNRFLTRSELMTKLKIKSGGTLSSVLSDLEKSGFIDRYYPFNLHEDSNLVRYAIVDNYLQFYFKFIKPFKKNINNGDYNIDPKTAINTSSYIKWLGFAFERWCRKYHYVIAKILGFSGVHYKSGAFFNRATNKDNPGYQIDLIFDRADKVCTVCEIKYLQDKVGTKIIDEMERKIELLPNSKNKTIQRVLITKEGIDDSLMRRHYFDKVITINELFDARYWI